MKHLIFEVKNQTLKRLDSFKPATNSVDYLTATFTFSEDWSSATKTAKCRTENNAVYAAVIDSKGVCLIPHEVLAQDAEKKAFGKQSFYIWVEGVNGSEKITTAEMQIELALTGEGDELNVSNPSPDLFAQYVEAVQAATGEAAEKAEEAAASATASAASMKNDYANALKGNESGAAIRLDDVSPVEHYPVVRVHSKNLAPSNKVEYTNSGYKVTPNSDGSVTVTGAATTTSPIYLSVALKKDGSSELLTVLLKAGKKYRFSAYKDGELTTKIAARIELENGITIYKTANYIHNYTDTTQNRELAQLYIQSIGHEIGDTSLCGTYKVQLEEGEEVTEYTPYIDPTTLTLKKFGKNLAPSLAEGETVTSNGVTFTGKANGGISAKGTPAGISRYALYYGAPLVRSGYITLSLSGEFSNIVPDFQLRDKDENIVKQIQTGTGATINLDNYEGIAFWDIAIKRQTDGVDVSGTVHVQLEIGDTATTYEKCTETEYTPEADGTINGLTTIAPTMTLLTEHEGVTIDCEYNVNIAQFAKNVNAQQQEAATKIKNNADNISANAKNIDTNTKNIAANAKSIATNASDISKANENISANTKSIATNASNISKANQSISANTKEIAQLAAYMPLRGLKILCLGDSIMGNDQTDGVPSFLAQYSGATVYNGGLGGTRLTARSNTTDDKYWLDAPRIIDAFVSGNWSNQIAAGELNAAKGGLYAYFDDTVNMLSTLDIQSIDIITLAYGTNDWTSNVHLADVLSAYEDIINTIESEFPHIRILIITPIWRYFGNNAGDSTNYKGYADGYTLAYWAEQIEKFAKEFRTSCLNAYETLSISKNNAAYYFDKNSSTGDGLDHTHLNTNGNKMYAHIINGKLSSIF